MHVSLGSALTSATRGLTAAQRLMDTAAEGVANDLTEDDVADDGNDLVSALVDATILAPVAYSANAAVIRAADEAQRSLLDIRV